MREHNVWRLIVASLIALILMIGVSMSAVAQDVNPKTATPQPSPTNNGGSAQWTINAETFESQFPKGVTFTIDVTSSGGKIASAGVVWRHGPDVAQSRRPGTVDPKTGKITAVWAAGQDAVPQWVSFEYWWVLTDAAGNTYVTPHKFEDYADNTRVWHHAESVDVVIYWQDGIDDQIGPVTIDVLQKMRPVYLQAWGRLLNYRPHVIVYADYDTWNQWNAGVNVGAQGNGMIVSLQGQTFAPWGGTAQVINQQAGYQQIALQVVPHEIDHLYQAFNGGVAQLCWFVEGDASYFENIQYYDYLARVQDLAASGDLPTLQGTGPSCQGANARDAYDIGYSFFKWLAATYGTDAHLKVWSLVATGKSVHDALQSVTGEDFVAMETDFRSWLGMANPAAPTLLPTMGFQFQATPTYEPTISQ